MGLLAQGFGLCGDQFVEFGQFVAKKWLWAIDYRRFIGMSISY